MGHAVLGDVFAGRQTDTGITILRSLIGGGVKMCTGAAQCRTAAMTTI